MPGVLRRERGRVCPQTDFRRVGLFQRIDVVFTVPRPRPLPVSDSTGTGWNQANLGGFVGPREEDTVEDRASQFVPLDGDVGPPELIVEATARVVVVRRIERGHVVRQTERAADLIEDLALEHRVRTGRLLGLELLHFPLIRQRDHRPLLDLDRLPRIYLGNVSCGSVGLQESGEVRGRFCRGDHRRCVTPHVGKQPQRRRHFGEAAMLRRPQPLKPVDDVPRLNAVELKVRDHVVGAGVVLESLVGDDVPVLVELQAVHDRAFRRRVRHVQTDGRCDHLGFDEPEIELHVVVRERAVRDELEKRFPVDQLRPPHRAELVSEVDAIAPPGERPLDHRVEFRRAGVELDSRPGADHVVGDRVADAGEIGVVERLVSSPIADRPPTDLRELPVHREPVGIRPVANVVPVLGDVDPGTHAAIRRRLHRRRLRCRLEPGEEPHVRSSPEEGSC